MAPFFGLVKQLQYGKNRFAMKMRMTRGYDKPFFNGVGVQTFEVVFHDMEGNKVHASVQNSALSKIKPVLKEGRIYAINDFTVVENTLQYKTTTCPHKILIFSSTSVARVFDETFPSKIFSFKSFDEIVKIQDAQKNNLFDVIGVVVSSYRPQTIIKNGHRKTLMEVVLENLENETMACTLWDAYADELYEKISQEPEETVCVIIQCCRVSKFRDEIKVTSSYDVTQILCDDSIKEIREMKDKYSLANKERKITMQMLEAPGPKTVEDEINEGSSTLKTIAELKVNEPGSFWVYGEICEVKTFGKWAYPACKICYSKLKKEGNSFFCEKCQRNDISGRLRYRLRVVVADKTGTADFTLWDKECEQLVGKPAAELCEEIGGYDRPFHFDEILSTAALFKVVIKHGETIMYDGAYMVNKINCDQEMIAKYSRDEGGIEDEAEVEVINTIDLTPEAVITQESGSKRVEDEAPGPVVLKRSRRVEIKKEKFKEIQE